MRDPRARPVGAIEAKQKTKGEDWQRNDRLIAVAAHAQTHQNVQSLEDLRPHLIDEIQEFLLPTIDCVGASLSRLR
jgi:inorganic pyrophosphatase